MRFWRNWHRQPRYVIALILLTLTACGASTRTGGVLPDDAIAAARGATQTPAPIATATQAPTPAPIIVSGTIPPGAGTAIAASALPVTATTTVMASRSPGTVTAVAQTANPTNEARRTSELQSTAMSLAQGTPRPATTTPRPTITNATVAATAAQPVRTMVATPPRSPVPNLGTPRSLPSAEGAMIQVGERRLWMACRGEGNPTVLMEAGFNTGSTIWSLVFSGVATSTRVCVYDRAGLGRSDPIPRPRTSQEAVGDLHGLLVNAGIPGPYVFVAHSFGGLNVRLYQSEYPDEVLGMVLVDTVHEDRFAATARVLTPEQQREFERGRAGIPPNNELLYRASSEQVREHARALPNIPVVVIARGRGEPWPHGYPADTMERVWRELQADLAARAPQGRLLIAEEANHNIPGEQPQIVIDTTRRMVDQVRMEGRR